MSARHPAIVIISDHHDAHLPYVTKHLDPASVVVFDPQTLLRRSGLSYQLNRQAVDITHKGISLSNVKSVWYRKPTLPPTHLLPVAKGFAEYSHDALVNHFEWFLDLFDDALWISDYYSMVRAGNKMLQLRLARQLGFRTPETLLTSDPNAAAAFLGSRPSTIIKPTSRYCFPLAKGDKKQNCMFLATKIPRGQHVNLANLHLAPSIFQQAVEDIVADIRVTVVGGQAFAASITNPGFDESTGTRDWRVGYLTDTLRIEPHALPPKIAALCAAHVRELGLKFGALDLILDTKGQYWFIENNPNGQWAFIEDATNQPIGQAIANLLNHTESAKPKRGRPLQNARR